MKNWQTLKVGERVVFAGEEFGLAFREEGIVTEAADDHMIVESNGMHLWLDDFNADLFTKSF